jgi:hypothetical protein
MVPGKGVKDQFIGMRAAVLREAMRSVLSQLLSVCLDTLSPNPVRPPGVSLCTTTGI